MNFGDYRLRDHGFTVTTFRQLMLELADRIGRQHFAVRDDAGEISDILRPYAVHAELMKRIVRDVYRANRCGHLDASISSAATFTALGKIRGDMTRLNSTDIDQLNLLEDIGSQLSDIFNARPWTDAEPCHATDERVEPNVAMLRPHRAIRHPPPTMKK